MPGTGDKQMKLIIAGGRNYRLTAKDVETLDSLQICIEEVVSGGAQGADKSGESYAFYKKIPVKRFPADWQTHGRAAGPIRNKAMAEYADAVALFPGGKGTGSMFREAKAAGLTIYDFRGGEHV